MEDQSYMQIKTTLPIIYWELLCSNAWAKSVKKIKKIALVEVSNMENR